MSDLFLRRAVLKVGPRGKPGKEFDGLKIQFEVEKNSESFANPGKITIFNLNKDSRGALERKDLVCFLSVGYGEAIGQIFQGDITKVKSEHNGIDWTTQIEAGDGQFAIEQTTFDKSYQAGVTMQTMLNDVIGSFTGNGLSVGAVEGVKQESFNSGVTLSGSAKEILDDLTKKQGLEWSIQDGTIQILSPTDKTKEVAILCSKESGLIGRPAKREQGLELKMLINPEFRPGRALLVESKEFNGIYRIRKVVFSGDSHEGEFVAKIETV